MWNQEKKQWISADAKHDLEYYEGPLTIDGLTLNVKGWSYSDYSTGSYYILPVN